MLATHLLGIHELTPEELCNFIETRFYSQVDALLKSLDLHSGRMEDNQETGDTLVTVSLMLYTRLGDECRQLMRFDRQLIFPLIREIAVAGDGRSLPKDAISHQHERIMKLMDKLRKQAHNYVIQSGWSNEFRMFCDDAFSLEQCMQQAIYIKENLLLPRIEHRQ